MNGRRYLASEHSVTKSFIPNCGAVGEVTFENYERFILRGHAGKEMTKKTLVLAWEEATLSYGRIKARRSILSESLATTEALSGWPLV